MTTALAAGSLSYDGPQQIRMLNPIIIAQNNGGGEATAVVQLRMRIPSGRLRSKLSIFFVPTAGGPASVAGFATIWVSAREENYHGAGGGGGGYYVVTDLEGTQAAPFAIGATAPHSSADVNGYAREFVTAADWIGAELTLSSMVQAGFWVAQARTEPAFTSFLWPEWDELRRLFSLQIDQAGVT